MAWTTPLTAVANASLTAAQWNASARDNLNETAAAKATAAGRIFVATGVNAIAERVVAQATVFTSQTTASTTFTDLATSGPAVTVTTGTVVLVLVGALLANNTAGGTAGMSVAVTGASSVSPSDDESVIFESSAANDVAQMSYLYPITGLTAGSNVFTAKYHVNTGTGTFARRRLVVFPFGT